MKTTRRRKNRVFAPVVWTVNALTTIFRLFLWLVLLAIATAVMWLLIKMLLLFLPIIRIVM